MMVSQPRAWYNQGEINPGGNSMDAVNVIIPVVFMLGLGFLARKKNILSAEHNAGLKKLIFSILLPILVFNAAFTLSVDPKYMLLMGYMFGLQCLTLVLGFLLARIFRGEYAHVSPYLMTTIEGGNAFYPLYMSLVGAGFTSYFVLLDIPGVFMIFLVIPLILARVTAAGARTGEMVKNAFTNPVIVALLAGLILNLTGIAGLFMATPAYAAYEALANTATGPIAPLILFTLGYSFSIGRENLGPILKTLVLRLALMALGTGAAFLLFPWILQDAALKIAVMLFLMCPPAFASPIILEKLYRKDADGSFCSTYISVHMLATVLIFALLAVLT